MAPELKFGTVVRSVCGRDRYRVFVVSAIDEKCSVSPIVVADGALRKLKSAKHKNPTHLRFVAQPTEEEINTLRNNMTDEQILTICKKYDLFEKNS